VKIGGTLTIDKGATLIVAGPYRLLVDSQDRKQSGVLAIRGTLALQDGAELWQGVVWGKGESAGAKAAPERPLEAALMVRQSLTPELCPEIAPPVPPPETPGVVKRTHTDVGPPVPVAVKLVNIAGRAGSARGPAVPQGLPHRSVDVQRRGLDPDEEPAAAGGV
jgi:hypothetical protein